VKQRYLLIAAGLAAALSACTPLQRTLPNEIPVADGGPDQNVSVLTLVSLNGRGEDADGDSLSYLWYYFDAPPGSNALLYNYRSAEATFTPDTAGDYIFHLVVDDGVQESRPDRVTVTAN